MIITVAKDQSVIIGSRLAGTVISTKIVIAMRTGVIKANEPKLAVEVLKSLMVGLEMF